ncbi:hypothetical protein CPBF426_23000 [Xanthomonas arboricola pv. juglandis]|nr:hypothetical protein [Xanthomonas euroxanthea]SYZ54170.1 hypothetical protein CPBF426_23000 [Xanthomonas arboricola pv. juglandis]
MQRQAPVFVGTDADAGATDRKTARQPTGPLINAAR